jgi:O-methyltransferase domain
MESKALTSKLRYQAVFVRAAAIVILTAQLLVSATSLMTANPQLHGIILDLPDVVPSAITAAAALGLAQRSSVLPGDFFAFVPEADLYLLKHILHDWDDDQCIRILENCRRAMRPSGRLIVIEWLLGEIGEPGFAPFSDLNMMVILSGRERTLSEYRALLKQAGFRLDKSGPIRSSMTVIEAVAARQKPVKSAPKMLQTNCGVAAM